MRNKTIRLTLLLILIYAFNSAIGQTKFNLSAQEFEQKLQSTKDHQIVDVCTPAEYSERHLKDAMNVDYRNDSFEELIAHLDKSKPTFVYCFSGGRSASAAEIMRKKGFKEVYELQGGISKWMQLDKPVEGTPKTSAAGITVAQFNKMLATDKLVLVDFGAKWCPPCRKMEPILDKLSKEQEQNLKVVRIDLDKNKEIAKHFKVEILPTLMLFKNQQVLSKHEGFLDEEKMKEWITKNENQKAK